MGLRGNRAPFQVLGAVGESTAMCEAPGASSSSELDVVQVAALAGAWE